MRGFLLDTNVVSEAVTSIPNQRVLDWIDSVPESDLFLSVMTLGELRQGTAKLVVSKKRAQLESWIDVDIQARFAGRILSVTEAVADRWGWIMGEAQTKGKPLPVVDTLIAATAIEHDLIVATRNVDQLSRTSARIFNPWE